MKANEFFKKVGIEAVKSYIVAYEDHLTDELKRLVESHELVKDYYGLTKAKEHAESNYTAPEIKDALKQAIADVEACKEVSSESN